MATKFYLFTNKNKNSGFNVKAITIAIKSTTATTAILIAAKATTCYKHCNKRGDANICIQMWCSMKIGDHPTFRLRLSCVSVRIQLYFPCYPV